MARTASADPLEKFRFSVTIISIDLSVTGAVDTFAALAQSSGNGFLRTIGSNLSVLTRAGFSEIVLPKVSINEMKYRENIDNQRFSKGAGLAAYEPVVLRRGVTSSSNILGSSANRDLYNWYRLVNDDSLLLGAAQELTRNSSIGPIQSENYRKEVVIGLKDREGNEIKQWILFNAFPTGYKGGNDLNSTSEEKLIEEITLSYEFFLELDGGISGLAKELAENVAEGIGGSLLQSTGLGSLPPSFTR